MIWAYIRAGGAAETSRPRGGLPAEVWALDWHRLWIIAWYLDQAAVWMPEPDRDAFVASVVRPWTLCRPGIPRGTGNSPPSASGSTTARLPPRHPPGLDDPPRMLCPRSPHT
ncbi:MULTISPECIES: hypothetical protein [Frankia]|uniref:hypothetical protein n=1 Tax=Frankia TaxID=1854 RepID=UPI0003FED392|nr:MULTISPECIES: hypothetical protein [Frankia]